MAKNIQVVKISASSTPQAWAQAYHAGNLTAVVAVTPKEKEDATSLHIVGKDLLNTFESEYFTLENKHLASIKQAVETTYKKSSATHTISFLVATAIQNTLYVVLAGNGSIFLIRKGKLGTLLSQETDEPIIQSSSGFLENGDIIALASPSFLKLVDKEKLFASLTENTLNEAGEMLTPAIHAATEGDAAAVFLQYEDEGAAQRPHEISLEAVTPQIKKDEEHEQHHAHHEEFKERPEEQEKKEDKSNVEEPIFSKPLVTPAPIYKPSTRALSHRRKILLTVVIILLLVLGATTFFAIRKQQEAKNAAIFASVYPTAQKKYEEGVGLVDLNPSVAHDDFVTAQQQLESIKDKLDANSLQSQQVKELLSKIQTSLTAATTANTVSATKVDTNTNPVLAYAASHADIAYITEDANNIYTADGSAITQITKKSQTAKKLVTNNNTWQSVGGFQTYLGNFYLLDVKAGILKFVPSGSTFTKSNYFATGVSPDLSNAKSIAIDGSIWIAESNGSILKFTKGKQDAFALTGIDKPLTQPTQIVTSVDMNNIYILDNGNGRIVALDKTGKFVSEYASSLLKNATQLVVDEKNKSVLFLSNNAIYQITLK